MKRIYLESMGGKCTDWDLERRLLGDLNRRIDIHLNFSFGLIKTKTIFSSFIFMFNTFFAINRAGLIKKWREFYDFSLRTFLLYLLFIKKIDFRGGKGSTSPLHFVDNLCPLRSQGITPSLKKNLYCVCYSVLGVWVASDLTGIWDFFFLGDVRRLRACRPGEDLTHAIRFVQYIDRCRFCFFVFLVFFSNLFVILL